MTPADSPEYRELLVDALIGIGLPSYEFAENAVAHDLATFTGDQFNEAWSWRRSALEAMDSGELLVIYLAARRAAGRPSHVTNKADTHKPDEPLTQTFRDDAKGQSRMREALARGFRFDINTNTKEVTVITPPGVVFEAYTQEASA
jgi:hypothetical protein